MLPTASIPVQERRRNRRHKVKSGTNVCCRKGSMGLGPNVAVRLLDICEDGAQLLTKGPMKPKEEVELGITPPGVSRALLRMADVVRCEPQPDGTFRLAARFRSMLVYSDMCHMF